MSSSNTGVQGLALRLEAVWYRHMRVYTRHLVSNGLPPFLEPLIFLVGIGLGLGRYIDSMDGFPYLEYLASGLLVTASMFTAAFECTFGTFIRLEFEKTYDGMLGAAITSSDLMVGEVIWAGSKGLFFSLAVLIVILAFGILPVGLTLVTPLVGMLTGLMFGALGIAVTSFVNNINHFNFFFSGFLSPMFFFSGVVFPVENLPRVVRPLAEALPLTHVVRLSRALALNSVEPRHLWDFLYILVFTVGVGWFGIVNIRKRLID